MRSSESIDSAIDSLNVEIEGVSLERREAEGESSLGSVEEDGSGGGRLLSFSFPFLSLPLLAFSPFLSREKRPLTKLDACGLSFGGVGGVEDGWACEDGGLVPMGACVGDIRVGR